MIYTELTKTAMSLALEAHKDQVDKNGFPYIHHPLHLAEEMDTEESVCVALLHDVVEDSDITFDDLAAKKIPERILKALRLLTRTEEMPYMEYIAGLAKDPLAAKVKKADLRHNSDPNRLKYKLEKEDADRLEKYRKALEYLDGVE